MSVRSALARINEILDQVSTSRGGLRCDDSLLSGVVPTTRVLDGQFGQADDLLVRAIPQSMRWIAGVC